MQHVADDGDGEAREVLLVMADGEEIEQPLGRVRVPPVAGVHHVLVRLDVARDEKRRARGVVPHDEDVGLHRRQIRDRVEQRLALRLRGDGDVQVDHVGGQALRRDLERGAGARRGLEEQIEDALAAQQRHLFHFAFGDADERFGGIEDLAHDLARQALDGEQMLQLALGVELRVTLQGLAPARARACRSLRA